MQQLTKEKALVRQHQTPPYVRKLIMFATYSICVNKWNTLKSFDDMVRRIFNKDYSEKATDHRICSECDFRLEQARECLSAAEVLADAGYFKDAANRSYYNIFHAMLCPQ